MGESAASAALQVPSSLLALDPEDQQLLLVLVFGSVVLVSPYIGIKMAQKGIEDANDILAPKDNKRNLKGNDPDAGGPPKFPWQKGRSRSWEDLSISVRCVTP